PWQRLLGDAAGEPPETTDARIRAAARRDLAPRFHRWWLPASLAASFVFAVFVVQSQFGTLRVPVARESDHGAGGAMTARIIEPEDAAAARPQGASPAAAGKRAAEARVKAEADAYGYQDSELAADSAGTGPMIGGPERELKEAMERPQNSDAAGEPQVAMDLPSPPPAAADENAENLGNVVVTGSRRRPEETAVTAAQSPTQGMTDTPATTRVRPPPFEKTPETWYAYVEKLRTQGKVEEADRQLARLEKAHPGWVERYLQDRAER
ncbi:MAG TPA: hypothetical protein VNO53_07690, partial [Steroidobacteraceae bacterium]|nr:hypothetical protein [Steroidobacteraceae bacterium]